jgi:hypothetical protein
MLGSTGSTQDSASPSSKQNLAKKIDIGPGL